MQENMKQLRENDSKPFFLHFSTFFLYIQVFYMTSSQALYSVLRTETIAKQIKRYFRRGNFAIQPWKLVYITVWGELSETS